MSAPFILYALTKLAATGARPGDLLDKGVHGRPMPCPVPSDMGAPTVALHPTLHTLTMTAQDHTLGPSGCLCAARLSLLPGLCTEAWVSAPSTCAYQQPRPSLVSSLEVQWLAAISAHPSGQASTCTLCVSRFSPHQVAICPWRPLT